MYDYLADGLQRIYGGKRGRGRQALVAVERPPRPLPHLYSGHICL